MYGVSGDHRVKAFVNVMEPDLYSYLDDLPARERIVVVEYFGLEGTALSLREIAARHNSTGRRRISLSFRHPPIFLCGKKNRGHAQIVSPGSWRRHSCGDAQYGYASEI